MIVQIAFLRCRPDQADNLAAALARVAAVAIHDEPETLDYLVLRGPLGGDTILFTTVETFSCPDAMEAHNTSACVAAFFDDAGPMLSGAPEVIVNTVVPAARS